MMAGGINDSEKFLCCLSNNYKSSKTAKKELEYASKITRFKETIVFVCLEAMNLIREDIEREASSVMFILGNQTYYNYTLDNDQTKVVDEDQKNILKVLG